MERGEVRGDRLPFFLKVFVNHPTVGDQKKALPHRSAIPVVTMPQRWANVEHEAHLPGGLKMVRCEENNTNTRQMVGVLQTWTCFFAGVILFD